MDKWIEEAFRKINNTLHLNQAAGNLKYNLDSEDDFDCKDVKELVNCLDIIEEALNRYTELTETCIKSFLEIKKVIIKE